MSANETKKTVKKRDNNVDYNVKVLEVKNLKKYFRVGTGKNKLIVPAVDNVTFDIYKREIFGLVGESGSGKTTTGRTIIKLYNPTEGTVTLNSLKVSAGHMEYVRNIRHIKRNLRKALIALEPTKMEVEKIRVNLEKRIKELEHEIKVNNYNLNEEILVLEEDLTRYKNEKYLLSEQLKLDLDRIKYDYTLGKDRIIKSTHNVHLNEYREEVEIEKTKFKNKFEGLKDSAALSKEEITKRIEELKVEHNEQLKVLEEKYKDLIVKGQEEAVDKKIAKEQIKEIKEKFKADRQKTKEQFIIDNNKIIEPDREGIANKTNALKEEYLNKNKQLEQQIKDEKAQAKQKIADLIAEGKKVVLSVEAKEELKNNIAKLKAQAKEDINAEKLKIATARQINNSKEALHASRMMQMIFQDPISSLNPRMTVREIVGEGLTILGQHTKEEINEKVDEILQVVGLAPEFATRYPHEFSGGQRQRIGIARALIMNPNFIIADEPISALDVSIQAQVINLISELKDKLDLTVLFIAHDLSVVRFFCDRVAVMHAGKVVELADTDELFKNPMHPYTISLLSAIPQPDPDYEKGRKRIHYNPMQHNYLFDKPSLQEIAPNHFVYANEQEFNDMKKVYNKNNKEVK